MCTRASFSHAVLDRGGAGELSEIKSGLYKHYAAMCRMFTYYCARVDKSGDHLHIVMQVGAPVGVSQSILSRSAEVHTLATDPLHGRDAGW